MSDELLSALDAWRADRSSIALATAVDDASARLVLETPPKKKQHRWWTTRARAYDPVTVASLLATLRWNARGKNVAWRTIVLRDTPLVAELRAQGRLEAGANDEWLNLLDRIGLMLTWPDDPRVALTLARLLFDAPFAQERRGFRGSRTYVLDRPVRAAIAKRLAEIGDLRALEIAAAAWHRLEISGREQIDAAINRAPPPRVVAVPDEQLEGLWAAVCEEPASLDRRLVLADAYGERGDSRGEMIALQCAPLLAIERARAAGVEVDASGLFGANAEQIARAIRTNWHRWLGDVALVVQRSARFSGGLLSDITVGGPATPPWVWDRVVDHRELCAVNRVAPTRFASPVVYARFVLGLARMPSWVTVNDEILDLLRSERPVQLTGVQLATGRTLTDAVRDVRAIAPALSRIDFGIVQAEQLPEIRRLADGVHIRFTLERELGADRALLDELRAMPNVFVLSYGL